MSLFNTTISRLIPAIETSTVPFLCSGYLKFDRCFSFSSSDYKESPNKDYTISKVYENRNPRNLEKLGLARKRLGWKFQAPRKDFYHKLVISHTVRHTEAWIEHSTGDIVISASTKEWAIRNQLYSCNDVSACVNVGKVLAQRCLESGINAVFFDDADKKSGSARVSS
ncbi:39S ribosomal protein L18, mitochondrial [Bulinus truncatus]|nr:39S ribosomal protein L18, mitochondrial [Bulinus truncatus]